MNNGHSAMGAGAMRNGQVYRLTETLRREPPMPVKPVAQSVNAKVLQYAKWALGRKLGDGQSTVLVSDALLTAGAEPGRNNVWGTVIRDARDVKPGDIVHFQYDDGSRTVYSGSKTAVVVATQNNSVQTLEQGTQSDRVQWGQFNTEYKTAGTVTFYRPIAKPQAPTPFDGPITK